MYLDRVHPCCLYTITLLLVKSPSYLLKSAVYLLTSPPQLLVNTAVKAHESAISASTCWYMTSIYCKSLQSSCVQIQAAAKCNKSTTGWLCIPIHAFICKIGTPISAVLPSPYLGIWRLSPCSVKPKYQSYQVGFMVILSSQATPIISFDFSIHSMPFP